MLAAGEYHLRFGLSARDDILGLGGRWVGRFNNSVYGFAGAAATYQTGAEGGPQVGFEALAGLGIDF